MTVSTNQKYRKVLGDLDLKRRDVNNQSFSESKYLGLQTDKHLT